MKMNDATKSKYSKDQPFLGCIARFPRAMLAIAKVSADGVKKHDVPMGDMSYMDLPDGYNLYTEALSRHLLREQLEGMVDPEFGHLHAAHAAWDALARLEIALAKLEAEKEEAAFDWGNSDTWDRPPLKLHGVEETSTSMQEFEKLLDKAAAPSSYDRLMDQFNKAVEFGPADDIDPAEDLPFEFTHDAQCFTYRGGECDCPNKPAAPSIPGKLDFPKFPTHGEIYCPIGTDQRWQYEGNSKWVNLAAFTEKGQPKQGVQPVGKYEEIYHGMIPNPNAKVSQDA